MTPENPLAALLADAGREHLCTRPHCTRCGVAIYRQRLARLAAPEPGALVEALANLDLAAWYDVQHPGGALQHTFDALGDSAAVDRVLGAWLGRIEGHYRLVDGVLFYVLREGHPARRQRA